MHFPKCYYISASSVYHNLWMLSLNSLRGIEYFDKCISELAGVVTATDDHSTEVICHYLSPVWRQKTPCGFIQFTEFPNRSSSWLLLDGQPYLCYPWRGRVTPESCVLKQPRKCGVKLPSTERRSVIVYCARSCLCHVCKIPLTFNHLCSLETPSQAQTRLGHLDAQEEA